MAHKDALPEPHRSEAGVPVDHCMVILCDLEEVFLEVRTDGCNSRWLLLADRLNSWTSSAKGEGCSPEAIPRLDPLSTLGV